VDNGDGVINCLWKWLKLKVFWNSKN
jgi:hypothetical protein